MNERLLTPEYASPEQIIGGAITTQVMCIRSALFFIAC